jgi:hypothetical protein
VVTSRPRGGYRRATSIVASAVEDIERRTVADRAGGACRCITTAGQHGRRLRAVERLGVEALTGEKASNRPVSDHQSALSGCDSSFERS